MVVVDLGLVDIKFSHFTVVNPIVSGLMEIWCNQLGTWCKPNQGPQLHNHQIFRIMLY